MGPREPLCCLQAGIFASAGVDKIRLTGGEPTLRRDLVELTAALRALPGVSAVGLTTNGLTLSRKLSALQAAGSASTGTAFALPCHAVASCNDSPSELQGAARGSLSFTQNGYLQQICQESSLLALLHTWHNISAGIEIHATLETVGIER